MNKRPKNGGASMTKAILAIVLIHTVAPAAAQIVNNDESKAKFIDFDRTGEMSLDLQAGKRRAIVKFIVAEPPSDWPRAIWMGPGKADMGADSIPARMITKVDILVDGCAVDQPWPAITGFADPKNASLQFVEGHWQLRISGGDGAESYGIVYAFDNKSVLARQLTWGPVFDEDTRYAITVDPDIAPRYCEPSADIIPAKPPLPSTSKPR